MQILKDDFNEKQSIVEDAIKEAKLISIDFEFTGLSENQRDMADLFDTVQQRYSKLAVSAANYLPMQVGICCFTEDQGSFIAKPFNFYIYPCQDKSFGIPDKSFSVQSSSFVFLMNNKFDFNTWISKGIPYISVETEKELKAKFSSKEEIVIDDGNREYVDESCRKISNWLQNETSKTLLVNAASGYHKKLLHQVVKKKFNGYLATSRQGKFIQVRRLTQEERDAKMALSSSAVEIEELIGFRKVLDLIASRNVPIVGHNCMLDMCHLIHHFYSPLPESVVDFKKIVNETFPMFYDSKYVAHAYPKLQNHFESTVLELLYEKVLGEPFNVLKCACDPDFDRYLNQSLHHEAGYDAYTTGVCFLRMINYLEGGKSDFNPDGKLMKECLNRIFLMRSTMLYMHLTGEDDIPDTSKIYYMSKFPTKWKTKDIMSKFKEQGLFHVKWIDDTSCFLILKDSKNIEYMDSVVNDEKKQFSLVNFNSDKPKKRKRDSKYECIIS